MRTSGYAGSKRNQNRILETQFDFLALSTFQFKERETKVRLEDLWRRLIQRELVDFSLEHAEMVANRFNFSVVQGNFENTCSCSLSS